MTADVDLARAAYHAYLQTASYADHDGAVFALLLERDPAFLPKHAVFLEGEMDRGGGARAEHRDYTFIWRLEGWRETVLVLIVPPDAVDNPLWKWRSVMRALFETTGRNEAPDAGVCGRQDQLLSELIRDQFPDEDRLEVLFSIISYLSLPRFRHQVEVLLSLRPTIDLFRSLAALNHMSWEGSPIPTLRERETHWRAVCNATSGKAFLEHRLWAEEQLGFARKEIEAALESEFVGDD